MDLASLTPLGGGWSGETFLGEAAGERVVVRIYASRGAARGDRAPDVDAAALRLVRGLVPVPEVLEVHRPRPALDAPGLLVTSWVEGVRGDELLPTLDAGGQHRLGVALGRLAADLAAMPVLRGGTFTDADLTLGDRPGPDTLVQWVHDHARAWAGWDDDERRGLLAVADEADDLLLGVTWRSLVHGDLDPKNVLVDAATLEVRALLDWELAHAGHPFTDLGNLLRLDRAPAYVDGVLEAWTQRHGTPSDEACALGRAADLWALVDLAGRAGPAGRPAHDPAERAAVLLREVARRRDASAWPAGWADPA